MLNQRRDEEISRTRLEDALQVPQATAQFLINALENKDIIRLEPDRFEAEGRALIFCDVHIPFQDDACVNAVIEHGLQKKVNIIIINGDLIEANIPTSELIIGKAFVVDNTVEIIVLESIGVCPYKVTKILRDITLDEYQNTEYSIVYQGCSWKHLTDVVHYNSYYGIIEPYIIEYSFSILLYSSWVSIPCSKIFSSKFS